MATPVGDSYSCDPGGVIAAGRYHGVAADSLSLNDATYQRIYQRVGSSKSIAVSGSYTGSPTRILGRAVPAGSALSASPVSYPWQTIATNPTGGTFSGSISVPTGDGWVMQIRDSVNASIGATGTHSFGVGIMIALLGQSNMENSFSAIEGWPLGSPQALVKQGTSPIYRLGNINDAFPAGSLSAVYGSAISGSGSARTHGNPIVFMANDLAAHIGGPVLLLTYAASGTTSAMWQPGDTYLNNFLNGLDSVGGDCEFIIWLQGESDAGYSISAVTYQTNLTAIFNQIKSHIGRSVLNFGVVCVGPATEAWATEGTMGPIRQGQLALVSAKASEGAYLAGTDIDGNLAGASSVHIDTPSLFAQGRRYTESIKRLLDGAANNIQGPSISSASRSGATITVNVSNNGGTSLKDGAGGSGSSLLGFRVLDDGAPVTISATAISGNTITLTLVSTPTGTVTMDYAMANAPFGSTTSPASVCYDNQTIPGSSVGLPLQPKPLFTVS